MDFLSLIKDSYKNLFELAYDIACTAYSLTIDGVALGVGTRHLAPRGFLYMKISIQMGNTQNRKLVDCPACLNQNSSSRFYKQVIVRKVNVHSQPGRDGKDCP